MDLNQATNSAQVTHHRNVDPMETDTRSGKRFIPVRIRDGKPYLNTYWVADTPEDAVAGARFSDLREMDDEWVEENTLVGVAEVVFDIIDIRPLQSLGLAGD